MFGDLKQTIKTVITEVILEGYFHIPSRRELIATRILSALILENPSSQNTLDTVRNALRWTDELIKQLDEEEDTKRSLRR